MSISAEAKSEVERLLRAGDRQRAIQYLINNFNISSQDASVLVEALEREMALTVGSAGRPSVSFTTLEGPLKGEVARLLTAGRKPDAVKLVRTNLNLNLKQSLVMVEEVAREVIPGYVSYNATGCLQTVAKGVGVFLLIASSLFLVAAGVIYFLQLRSIGNSDRVTGVVTQMNTLDTGESAPVIAYEWKGNKRSYESTFYSSPPDYEVGQVLSLFVDRDDAGGITLDTFADRYALIVGLAVPGAILLLVSIVFIYFARSKF